MLLSKKVYCEKCNLCEVIAEKQQTNGTKPLQLEATCDNCVKVVTSYSNTLTKLQANSPMHAVYHPLPHKTIFFHLNEDIFYEDSRFSEQNKEIYQEKSVLIIGCGSIKRSMILMNLKKLKFKRLVNLVRRKTWTNDYFNDFIYAEHEDIKCKEETLKSITDYMDKNKFKFDAIFTFDDYSVLLTSYVTSTLGYPGIPFDICQKIKDKHLFRELSSELGISHPNFNFLTRSKRKDQLEKIDIFLEEIGHFGEEEQSKLKEKYLYALTKLHGSIVVKNSYGSGKDFVRKCYTLEDYRRCLHDSIRSSNHMDLVIEEYYDGHEIDIDILVQHNECVFMAISDNFAAQEPYFFERGGTTPSLQLANDEQAHIRHLIFDWIQKLNIQNACLHFEARCKPKALYGKQRSNSERFLMPIEINLRLGGAEVYSMILASHGVNLFLETLDIALNMRLDRDLLRQKQDNPRFNCISYDFHPASNVLLHDIQINMSKLQTNLNAIEVAIFRSVGDRLSLQDYVGWITVKSHKNATVEELLQLQQKLLDSVRFSYMEII